MNKFSLFILLILLFLGLSKSFSPSEQKTFFIQNQHALKHFFKSKDPVSVMLIDRLTTGFLIKTYYLKLKVIHGFKSPQVIVVRCSQKYWKEQKDNIGMGLFRRLSLNDPATTTPMPPGIIYIGNSSFGRWIYSKGRKVWQFYSAYRSFPEVFKWGHFIPTFEFYLDYKNHLKAELPFYGLNREFGSQGSITQEFIIGQKNSTTEKKVNLLKKYIRSIIQVPPWKIETKGLKES